MTRLPTRPAPFIQRGLTLIELMIAMLLGLIVVSGVLGIFASNSEAYRLTGDLARVQENARVAVQLMGRSMREAGGNPCGLPSSVGLIHHMAEAPTSNWWSGGDNFSSSLVGYRGGSGFPSGANGGITMVPGSDAVVTVSGNAFAKAVISDTASPGMIVHSNAGFATGDILFACSTERGLGAVFQAGTISASGGNWSVARANPFSGAVASMTVTNLGKLNAEAWFVGENSRGGTSLYRAAIGSGQPEEVAQDVSDMQITYLLPNADQYVAANLISSIDWPEVTAAYIELTISRRINSETTIERKVGMTANLRNRTILDAGSPP